MDKAWEGGGCDVGVRDDKRAKREIQKERRRFSGIRGV